MALQPGDRGSIPGLVIPKTVKNGTHSLPAWRSASRVGLGGPTYWRHVQGVYLYIKLPHATETGVRLLPSEPFGSREPLVLKACLLYFSKNLERLAGWPLFFESQIPGLFQDFSQNSRTFLKSNSRIFPGLSSKILDFSK